MPSLITSKYLFCHYIRLFRQRQQIYLQHKHTKTNNVWLHVAAFVSIYRAQRQRKRLDANDGLKVCLE